MFLTIYLKQFINILDELLYKILSKILNTLGLLKTGYFINKKSSIITFRTGTKKSIWLMTKTFLIKLSLIPRLINKKDSINLTTRDVLDNFSKINPRCWDIIENSNRQQKISEQKKNYFPLIEINDYEIAHIHLKKFFFYETKSELIVELDTKKIGGFGHLIMEIFPILIYLSLKTPIRMSTKGLVSKNNIYESFARAYGIKTINPFKLSRLQRVNNEQIVSKYNLKKASKHSKYHYPNYNNICLMLKYLRKLPKEKNSYNKYIYVKRKEGTSTGRRLTNENKLERTLFSLGFKTIYPEDCSLEEQIMIFYNASIVVGVSGSALLNSIFCKKPSHVIELCPDVDFRPGVWLSTVISQSHHHFFFGPSEGKIVELKPERFSINTNLVIKRVQNIIKMINN